MSDQPEPLAAILAEMRKSAKDSYAEKTAKRLEDHEATGTRDALDIKDAIQCLRDDDKYLLDLADRIEVAVERERAEWRRQLRNEILINDALATTRPQFNYVDDVIAEAAKERAHEIELAKLRATGDAAAMRAALEKFLDFSRRGLAFFTSYRYTEAENDEIEAAFDEAKSALAAPARNCDRFATEDEAREAYWAYRDPLEFNDKPFVTITEWLFAPAEGGAE